MAKKHQYICGAKATRTAAGRKWRRKAKQVLSGESPSRKKSRRGMKRVGDHRWGKVPGIR